jgi:glycerol-3-phosphate acyltransferase PlsY
VEWIGYIVVALASYLMGSFPTGYLAGKARGLDIREHGSGNIGATNVFRILGKRAGTLVMLFDAFKGFASCWWFPAAAISLGWTAPGNPDRATQILGLIAGICAILGHNYTCWLHFKGGKGIATTAGVFLALSPSAILLTMAVWILVLAVSRIVSLASLAAAIVLPCFVGWRTHSALLTAATALIGALAIYKHKANIRRLLDGTEHRFGGKSKQKEQNS